ncbi:MAG: hypothetical protein PVI86_18445, partial [Phycisphaerae bacterium]
TPSAVMHKHLKDPLVPPDHVNPTLTSGIGEIIEVMMAKSPDDRYASASELITDLEAVSRGEPPFQARQKYDHDLLQSLATGRTKTEETAEKPQKPDGSGRVSVQWVIGLAVLLAVAVLCIIVLILTR